MLLKISSSDSLIYLQIVILYKSLFTAFQINILTNFRGVRAFDDGESFLYGHEWSES